MPYAREGFKRRSRRAAKAKAQIEAGAAVMAKGSAKEGEARGGVTSQRGPYHLGRQEGQQQEKGCAHARM